MMTAIRARTAAPPIPTTTPMTIFLDVLLRPEGEKSGCRSGTKVVGIRAVEDIVWGIVVTTPLMVVTTFVTYVLIEREKEVVKDVGRKLNEVVREGRDEEVEVVGGGTDNSLLEGIIELEGESLLVDVVGMTMGGEDLEVEGIEELSANCRLSTSLLACSWIGSAVTIDNDNSNVTRSVKIGSELVGAHIIPRTGSEEYEL